MSLSEKDRTDIIIQITNDFHRNIKPKYSSSEELAEHGQKWLDEISEKYNDPDISSHASNVLLNAIIYFNKIGNRNNMSVVQKFSFAIGVLLLITLLFIGIVYDCPDTNEANIFHILTALAGGAFAAGIAGFINVNIKNVVTAGGGLGAFVVILFFPPVEIQPCGNHVISGIITNYESDTNIEIVIPEVSQRDVIDEFGKFTITYSGNRIKGELTFRFLINDANTDTVIVIMLEPSYSSDNRFELDYQSPN